MKKIKQVIVTLVILMAFAHIRSSVSIAAYEEPTRLLTGQEVADVLKAEWNSETGKITLQKDVKLKKQYEIFLEQPITLDMNGYTISEKCIYIGGNNNPVEITGRGKFEQCRIIVGSPWTQDSYNKVTLSGDIVYTYKENEPITLLEGILVIRDGEFYSEGEYVLSDEYDSWRKASKLYIKGGNFHGNVHMGYSTYMYDGTIMGNVSGCGYRLYVKGGTIEGGIYCESEGYDEGCQSIIKIAGGRVLDQIKLEDVTGSKLEITGGTVKSSKEAVILAEASPSSIREYYPSISVKGGSIISTAKDGYGIKARNANIKITGGNIKNTTKKGCCGVYNPYYHYDCESVNESASKKATISGFKNKVRSIGNDKYCGKNVKFSFDKKTGTLTISGKGKMYDGFSFYRMSAKISRKTIKNVVVKKGVTYIGSEAFCCLDNLKTLKTGSTVKKIGEQAFIECPNLKTVNFNEGLKTLGEGAFRECSKMKITKIPSTLKTIGKDALKGTKYSKLNK